MDAVKWWNPSKLFSDIRSPSGNELGPSSIWKLDKEKAHQSCSTEVWSVCRVAILNYSFDRGLLSSESGHLDLAAVFTSSMPRSNHPQMFFFLPNETYLEQETAKCWSRLRWRFIFWCDFQHNNLARAATPTGRLRRMYTQILMFKNTTAAKCLKADFSGCAVWKGKTGVIIMAQTFWACTHGLSDSGKQSAMGSGSCGYQRV